MPLGNFLKNKFRGKSSNSSSPLSLSDKEKKALFGLKVVQAQQNPEPVYDLSGCSAPALPNDTFTFCKILGKINLIIKENCITSLETGGSVQDLSDLKVLDASCNKIEHLPSNIHCLKNLQSLNLSSNKLKSLPDTFYALQCLEDLNLSNNKFSKVPHVLCALPNLKVLSLKGNNITTIPKEFSSLHHSLLTFEIDLDKIENLPHNVIEEGFSEIMKYLCDQNEIEYIGNCCSPLNDVVDNISKQDNDKPSNASPALDDIMVQYMLKKQQHMRAQLLEEEKFRALEKEQLEHVLQHSSKSKEELLQEISSSPFEIDEYETKKQEKALAQMKIEEKFKCDQEEELSLYLNNSSNKEALLVDISQNENTLQHEIEVIVSAKEEEKAKLLNDLSNSEQETECALQELLNLQQSQKSLDFINSIKEQDEEMKNLLSNIVETSTEIRRSDVLKAMQDSLMEVALADVYRDKIEENQKSWVSTLMKEEEIGEKQLEELLKNKASEQESFLANFLKEEEYQAEAFKQLLLKMDLKRNSVVRQIALVEYELMKLSSLELRKQCFGVQDGSKSLLNQRRTLVDLLKNLFKAKEERDKELNNWVFELSENKNENLDSEDYWLLQYQKLMAFKPSSISDSEKNLDPKIEKILSMAFALDLSPVFAKHKITFSMLLDMTEEDFAQFNIGPATYQCIQRAIHSYLLESKLGPQDPSAPEFETLSPSLPSAPVLEDDDYAAAECLPPSAPPVTFLESECVVCLNSVCKVLFMPCGHVCVCSSCYKSLVLCPLCRSDILEKCYINI